MMRFSTPLLALTCQIMDFVVWTVAISSDLQVRACNDILYNPRLTCQQSPLLYASKECNCTNVVPKSPKNEYFICQNPSLGPQNLPATLPLLSLVSDYDRFGGMFLGEFLNTFRTLAKTTVAYQA